jgi:hypothetical protein
MWQPLKLPYVCERLTAFSIPHGDSILVVTYDEMFRVDLAPQATVTSLGDDSLLLELFDEQRGLLTLEGRAYHMLGLYGGVSILCDSEGNGLSLAPKEERLTILNTKDEILQVIKFSDLSGDWCWATYSPDFRYLVIGLPYDVLVYKR